MGGVIEHQIFNFITNSYSELKKKSNVSILIFFLFFLLISFSFFFSIFSIFQLFFIISILIISFYIVYFLIPQNLLIKNKNKK